VLVRQLATTTLEAQNGDRRLDNEQRQDRHPGNSERLRRYSRISLRAIAPTRRRLKLIRTAASTSRRSGSR
jgi:hypothetical protein